MQTGHMNSQQLLPRALHDEPRDAEATALNGLEPSVIRELEPPTAPNGPNGALRRDSRYRRLLVAADVCAGAITAIVAGAVGDSTHVTVQSTLLALVAPLAAKVLGLYDHDPARLRKSTLDELPALAQFAGLMSFLALISSPVLFDGVLGPREAIALFVVVLVALAVGRIVARRIGGTLISAERCLFIGPTDEALRFGEKLRHDHATNARLVAQIELDDASAWASPMVIDRAVADARELVGRFEIQRVIIAPHTSAATDTLDLMRAFGATGARVSVIPALLQVVGSAVEFDDVQGVAVLGVRSFSLPRSSKMVKRMFDALSASLGLALLAPLMAVTAVLIKLSSRGPVFFRQERVGRGGRPFELLKFRSMCVDAEERKRELAGDNEAAEGFFKIADDPRITPVGRMLRRTNIDELPQLLNVLRGEMSLVGPRPLIPQEDRRVVGWHRRRLELTPGMTGHWQVLGSSRVPLDEMVAIDYLYVANWSLWTDMKLLLRTVPHVLAGRGL
jgi:exopolysaccharide biosynthesis polyprenyl glycosylphosphotransferase